MDHGEFDEQEFRRKVERCIRLCDRGIVSGAETAQRIGELCVEQVGDSTRWPPSFDLERSRQILADAMQVLDEALGDRPFGDEARATAAFNLHFSLVERPQSWDALLRRLDEASRLLAEEREAALCMLFAIARSADPEVGALDDRQTQHLLTFALEHRLAELILGTLPPKAMAGHGRVDWERAHEHLRDDDWEAALRLRNPFR